MVFISGPLPFVSAPSVCNALMRCWNGKKEQQQQKFIWWSIDINFIEKPTQQNGPKRYLYRKLLRIFSRISFVFVACARHCLGYSSRRNDIFNIVLCPAIDWRAHYRIWIGLASLYLFFASAWLLLFIWRTTFRSAGAARRGEREREETGSKTEQQNCADRAKYYKLLKNISINATAHDKTANKNKSIFRLI